MDAQTTSEKRSALLAARTASSLAANGAVDEALLLLLDAAPAYEDTEFPDELLASFLTVLALKEHRTSYDIPEFSEIFKIENEIFFLGSDRKSVHRIVDSHESRLVETSDLAIYKILSGPSPGQLVLITEDLGVELVDWQKNTRAKVSQLKTVSQLIGIDGTSAGNRQNFPSITALRSGLILSQVGHASDDGDKQVVFFELLDYISDSRYEDRLPGDTSLTYVPLADGKDYLLADVTAPTRRAYPPDTDVLTVLQIDPKKLEAREMGSNEIRHLKNQLKLFRCFGSADAMIMNFQDLSDKNERGLHSFLMSAPDTPVHYLTSCEIVGNQVLISGVDGMSAGTSVHFVLVNRDGQARNLRDLLRYVPGDTYSSPTSLQAMAGHWDENSVEVVARAYADGNLLALLVFPDLVVMSLDKEEGYLRGSEHHRLTHFPDGMWFNDTKQLTLAYGARGRLEVFDSARTSESRAEGLVGDLSRVGEFLYSISSKNGPVYSISSKYGRVAPLNNGNCIGYTYNPFYENDSTSKRKNTCGLAKSDSDLCEHCSHDQELLLRYRRYRYKKSQDVQGLQIFDVTNSNLRAGKLVWDLRDDTINSAFFVNRSHDVVTSHADGRVVRWARDNAAGKWISTEVLRSDSEVLYAEPNSDGTRLLLVTHDFGTVSASLFSLAAQLKILDLATEYKYIGVTFSEDERIGLQTSPGGRTIMTLPTPEDLYARAQAALSPVCREGLRDEYRNSSCWTGSDIAVLNSSR